MHAPWIDRFGEFLDQAAIPWQHDVPLREFTTFRLGGATPCMVLCHRPDQVVAAAARLRHAGVPHHLIGDGSNLLVADEGLADPVIRFSSPAPEIQLSGNEMVVSAATRLDDLVIFAVERGLAVWVNCSGIPGTVGGAVVGNAGAFGWQIGDCLSTVRILNAAGLVTDIDRAALGFRYRHSELKDSGNIVLQATFTVTFDAVIAEIRAERQRILALRREKHPDLAVDACAGSFFKNIEPTSAAGKRQAAGWFLDEVGAKEMHVGGAGVYPKHANIIIRRHPSCRAADVDELARQMAVRVNERFGIVMEREVRTLGTIDR